MLEFTDEDRRLLVNFALKMMDRRIKQADEAFHESYERAKREVRDELGIDAIDQEIGSLEKEVESLRGRIRALNRKKEELGFDPMYDGAQPGSRAQALLERKTRPSSGEFKRLTDKKTELVGRIRGAETLNEALATLGEIAEEE